MADVADHLGLPRSLEGLFGIHFMLVVRDR